MNTFQSSDPFQDHPIQQHLANTGTGGHSGSGTVSYASSNTSNGYDQHGQHGQQPSGGSGLNFTLQQQGQATYQNQNGFQQLPQQQQQQQQQQGQANGSGTGEMDLSWMGDTSFLPPLQGMQGQDQVPVSVSVQGGTQQYMQQQQQQPQHQQQQQQQQAFIATSPSAGLPSLHPSSAAPSNPPSTSSVDRHNTFVSLLASMPNATDDPTMHNMYMQAVQYKVKDLELQIAEARRKEREAELEMARLKAVVDRRSSFRHAEPQSVTPRGGAPGLGSMQAGQGREQMQGRAQGSRHGQGQGSGSGNNLHLNVQPAVVEQTYIPTTSTRSHSFTTSTYPYMNTRPMLGAAVSPQNQKPNNLPEINAMHAQPASSSMLSSGILGTAAAATASNTAAQTTAQSGYQDQIQILDIESLMASGSADLADWMPNLDVYANMGLGNTYGSAGSSFSGMGSMSGGVSGGIDPNALRLAPTNPLDALNGSAIELDTDYTPTPIIKSDPDAQLDLDAFASPMKRKSSSGAESAAADEPGSVVVPKRPRKAEKKITVDLSPHCISCGKGMARVIVRALRAELPEKTEAAFTCLDCKQVKVYTDATVSPTAIGTVETRKRGRVTMEEEDRSGGDPEKRQFCDVCQRIIGSGWIRGTVHKARVSVQDIAEIVCASCESRYQRCTDCGGGGGGRINVGKWRLKEVFPSGRKTCSLSHSRLGDRQRDIGVHVTPADFDQQVLREVLAKCKDLWKEKNVARLAVPEMMEMDLPPNLINPLHSYSDIDKIIVENWPAREAMIRAEGADPSRFKRLLGLTWAHTKSRRPVRTVDIEEEHSRVEDAGKGDKSTVLDNIRMTDQVIPAGCELIGMWGGEWDIRHGSLLISTFIPFEGADGEDSAALSVGEIISKVQLMQADMNRKITAAQEAGEAVEPVPVCQHLWVVSGSTVPLVRERMADILIRKRAFVHLDEYLTRHPDFANAVRDRPYGLHPSSLALPNQPLATPASSAPSSPGRGTSSGPSNNRPLILARWLGNDFGPDRIKEIKEAEFGGKARQKAQRRGKKAAAA